MSKPLLAYWDIRGLAEPIRLMLEYSGVEYEQKDYVCSDDPPYTNNWMDEKYKLDLDFPNLPYFVNGNTKITESWAILKYVAEKFGPCIPNETKHLCDMTEGVVGEVRQSWISICYGNFDAEVEIFFNKLVKKLDMFDNYLSKHAWLGGDDITYVDFAFCEVLSQFQMFRSDVLAKHENVKKYLDKFEKLPKLVAYRQSNRFKKYPVNNRMAKWGGKAV
uniref:glutathione transferase n=1 Tax=Phallusia mammillata TaxID=59560 RepID=A0A6F9DES3_9ASCI|nr:glutathione S-transferase Mu 3-like [Phallusia mammillata]